MKLGFSILAGLFSFMVSANELAIDPPKLDPHVCKQQADAAIKVIFPVLHGEVKDRVETLSTELNKIKASSSKVPSPALNEALITGTRSLASTVMPLRLISKQMSDCLNPKQILTGGEFSISVESFQLVVQIIENVALLWNEARKPVCTDCSAWMKQQLEEASKEDNANTALLSTQALATIFEAFKKPGDAQALISSLDKVNERFTLDDGKRPATDDSEITPFEEGSATHGPSSGHDRPAPKFRTTAHSSEVAPDAKTKIILPQTTTSASTTPAPAPLSTKTASPDQTHTH